MQGLDLNLVTYHTYDRTMHCALLLCSVVQGWQCRVQKTRHRVQTDSSTDKSTDYSIKRPRFNSHHHMVANNCL